jgi:hypothetical protein
LRIPVRGLDAIGAVQSLSVRGCRRRREADFPSIRDRGVPVTPPVRPL